MFHIFVFLVSAARSIDVAVAVNPSRVHAEMQAERWNNCWTKVEELCSGNIVERAALEEHSDQVAIALELQRFFDDAVLRENEEVDTVSAHCVTADC